MANNSLINTGGENLSQTGNPQQNINQDLNTNNSQTYLQMGSGALLTESSLTISRVGSSSYKPVDQSAVLGSQTLAIDSAIMPPSGQLTIVSLAAILIIIAVVIIKKNKSSS